MSDHKSWRIVAARDFLGTFRSSGARITQCLEMDSEHTKPFPERVTEHMMTLVPFQVGFGHVPSAVHEFTPLSDDVQ